MVSKPQELCKADSGRVGVCFFNFNGSFDGILVMGGHYYLAIVKIIEDIFEICKIVFSG